MKKKCSKCLKEKKLDLFSKGRGSHERHNWCKSCSSEYHKKVYKSKKKEHKVNPYADYTINSDIWIHFYRFGIALEHEQVINILERIKKADGFLGEMDKIEAEFGCKDYDLSGIDLRFK